MVFASFWSDETEVRSESSINLLFESFSIPILPRFGVLMNLHAMILSSVTVVVMAIWNDLKGSLLIDLWSHLIPCFLVGLVCGVLSIAFGFLSSLVAQRQRTAASRVSAFASLCQSSGALVSAAVSLMAISNLVFVVATGGGLFLTCRQLIQS